MSVSEPGKIITPWAESGLKNPIPPAANPATGRAGFDQGFSAINMTAKEAGGIPPFGQDFNGIFYEVTNILRYMQAGGQPTFDAALATAIGGYPKGSILIGDDGVSIFQSNKDSNSNNPNSSLGGWTILKNVVYVEDFRSENPTDSGCIQAAINSISRGTVKLQPGRTYSLDADIVILNKTTGNPNGNLEIDCSGSFVTGTGNIVFDSCKYIRVVGLQMPNQDVILNGLWFSSFESCIFRDLVLSQSAGASFSASYWISYKDCNFQSVEKHAVNGSAHNNFEFYSCRLRGSSGQGFIGTADYAINLIGNSNTQSWKFYGGDISYHNIDVYNIDSGNTSDVELIFDGVYFDTLLPQLTDRDRTIIRADNCHNAIGVGARSPLKTSFSAVTCNTTDLFNSSRSFRFSGNVPKNLIPGGDLANNLGVWNGTGKPVSSAPAGTVFTSSRGGFSGNILHIDAPAGTIFFKSQVLPSPGKMTGCIVLRNKNAGEDVIQVSFNGLFEANITISDQYWTVFSLTSGSVVTNQDVSITVSKSPAASLNISVGFVGIFYGTDTPVLCQSGGFSSIEMRDTTWDMSTGIAANSQIEKVFTVPGAAFGDFVLYAMENNSTASKQVIFSAKVTAVDTVTVTASNPKASAITGLPASVTSNLRVWKLKLMS